MMTCHGILNNVTDIIKDQRYEYIKITYANYFISDLRNIAYESRPIFVSLFTYL